MNECGLECSTVCHCHSTFCFCETQNKSLLCRDVTGFSMIIFMLLPISSSFTESALRKGIDILVGTPGRILDHCQRGNLDLSRLK